MLTGAISGWLLADTDKASATSYLLVGSTSALTLSYIWCACAVRYSGCGDEIDD